MPERAFNNDPKKISEYLGIPVKQVEMMMEGVTRQHLDNLIGRGDFLLSTDDELKCLEYNVSFSLGGWEIPIWESLYLNTPIIARFFKENNIKSRNGNLYYQYLEHVVRTFLARNPGFKGEVHNALVMKGSGSKMPSTTGVYLNKLFKEILGHRSPPLEGSVHLCGYRHLTVKNKRLYFEDKPIHVVSELCSGEVPPEIMEVFKAGNIQLFNGPATNLIGNKLFLALLSDYENTAVFTAEEKKLIDKYVPWSRKIMPGTSTYKGERIDLEKFISANREKLVVKLGAGYGGKGVYVGKKTPDHLWEQAVKKAIAEKRWLVQEYIETTPGVYQVGDLGCALHDVSWGFFVFGLRYTGV
ncbi:MAG: hypothetical protein GY940_04420 [bacterium]|nr:hypothetical protein [bacterium]